MKIGIGCPSWELEFYIEHLRASEIKIDKWSNIKSSSEITVKMLQVEYTSAKPKVKISFLKENTDMGVLFDSELELEFYNILFHHTDYTTWFYFGEIGSSDRWIEFNEKIADNQPSVIRCRQGHVCTSFSNDEKNLNIYRKGATCETTTNIELNEQNIYVLQQVEKLALCLETDVEYQWEPYQRVLKSARSLI